ncbi:unnamed protein product [Discosporangium mesarthrocarpum]
MAYFESLGNEAQREVQQWPDRQRLMMDSIRQKTLEQHLREVPGFERRVRRLITLHVSCACERHGRQDGTEYNHISPNPNPQPKVDSEAKVRVRVNYGGGVHSKGTSEDEVVQGSLIPQTKHCHRPRLRPQLVALLKVWEANEATSSMLQEGAELCLHRLSAPNMIRRMPTAPYSIELSTRKNTKIELVQGATPVSTDPRTSSIPWLGHFGPRSHTPLEVLSAPANTGDTGSIRAQGAGASTQSREADVVGCVLAITKVDPTTGVETMMPWGGEGREATQAPAGGARSAQQYRQILGHKKMKDTQPVDSQSVEQEQLQAVGTESTVIPTCQQRPPASPCAAGNPASPVTACITSSTTCSLPAKGGFETYCVYFTAASGFSLRLERCVRTELVSHNRILSATPGTCWAVVNARINLPSLPGRAIPISKSNRHITGGGNIGGRGIPCYPIGVCLQGATAAGEWTPGTAATATKPGSGTLGGSPGAHLAGPLQLLKQWAMSMEGRQAIHLGRQRLAVVLAAEARVSAEIHSDSNSPSAGRMGAGHRRSDQALIRSLEQPDDFKGFVGGVRVGCWVSGFVTGIFPSVDGAYSGSGQGIVGSGLGVLRGNSRREGLDKGEVNSVGGLFLTVDTGARVLLVHLRQGMVKFFIRQVLGFGVSSSRGLKSRDALLALQRTRNTHGCGLGGDKRCSSEDNQKVEKEDRGNDCTLVRAGSGVSGAKGRNWGKPASPYDITTVGIEQSQVLEKSSTVVGELPIPCSAAAPRLVKENEAEKAIFSRSVGLGGESARKDNHCVREGGAGMEPVSVSSELLPLPLLRKACSHLQWEFCVGGAVMSDEVCCVNRIEGIHTRKIHRAGPGVVTRVLDGCNVLEIEGLRLLDTVKQVGDLLADLGASLASI